ncbi:separin protein [Didymosphaeria variabile]|uniref:Separin protein n=1 Tax=Didymosphaeria variabile TaxID=1932322 RepID=A0A9W8XTA7_9PLEO|nr:separin protein [Didymosphaeria variabile]KAJ4358184.1 separin protein [Didymosphaeria variabile]
MANEDATATRLENIETELQSIATFAEREPTAAKAEHGLSPRQRYILATQTVNATLKSLTDALKTPVTQRTAKSPPASKPSPTVATNAQKPHAKSSSVTNHPLKERSVSQATNSSTRPKGLRRSSSYPTFTDPDASLLATAECARLGFAYLSTSEGAQFVGKNSPELALENGRLSLVGKLVTHGLDSLAVKEMRLLKKRLDTYTLRKNGTEELRPASSRSASQQVPPPEKESLAALLDFGDVDRTNAAIPIIINLQIYVLRVIGRLKRPRHVEAVWNYLKLSHPSNPTSLILHTAKEKAQQPKAARQLESLAQTILNLCPSISPSDDDEQPQPSPDIVLCLQHLAFGVRQRWWGLAQHQGNKDKELIEPFGKCLVAFTRRSTLPAAKQYRIAESLYSNLLGTGKTTDFSQRDGQGLSELKNSTLASLARAADLPEEAFRWLGSQSSSFLTKDSSAAITVRSVRVASISLEACLKGSSKPDQDATIDTALERLSGSLDGTARDLETLLLEVHALRRVASRILSLIASVGNTKWSPTLREQCVRIVAISIHFSRRFMGSRPTEDSSPGKIKSYQARLAIAAKLVRSTVDAVSVCCRLPLTSDAAWEELDVLIQDCVRFTSQLEEESVDNDYAGFGSQEGTQSLFVKFSNSYWTLRRQLQKIGF